MPKRPLPGRFRVEKKALIFDIKRASSEDGPGIRTTVFFKGCPLACVWCHNPEGVNRELETDVNGEEVGYWISLDELLYRVLIDKPFFRSSGGGITISGGEPTLQMDFIHHFLKELKKQGVQTAIETCGLFNFSRFSRHILPYLDIIYFDLKLFDDEASCRFTGRSSQPMLANFARLVAESDIPVIPRIPLIPGITATQKNLLDIAAFLREVGVEGCTLIPYNPLWHDKLKQLGREAGYRRQSFLTQAEQNACIHHFHQRQHQG